MCLILCDTHHDGKVVIGKTIPIMAGLEDRDTSLAKVILNQKKRLSLQQASVIIFLGIAAVILLALLSYNDMDPGPFRQDSGRVLGGCANLVGCKGAWLANFLIGLLGYLAYALPVVLVVLGLTAFRIGPHMKNPNNPVGGVNDIVTGLGALLTLLSGAGLAHLLFEPPPVGIGGGLLGQVVGNFFMRTFLGYFGSVLFLLSLFLGSITIVGDISWAQVTEKVGDWILQAFEKMQTKQVEANPNHNTATLPEDSLLFKVKHWLGSDVKDKVAPVEHTPNPMEQALDWLQRTTGIGASKHSIQVNEGVDVTQIKSPPRARAGSRQEPILDVPDFADLTTPVAKLSSSDEAKAVTKKPKVTKVETNPFDEDITSAALKPGQIILPRLGLLRPAPAERVTQSPERLQELRDKLIKALADYGIKDEKGLPRVVNTEPGPVITRFELELPEGTKASKVSGLSSDLARNMCVSSVRVVEVIPGRPTIGVEVPNDKRDIVTISEMLSSAEYRRSMSPLTLALGKDISGNPVLADLTRMPHLLVAGTTGSGKSVFINAVLLSLLYKATPDEVRMIMIDPKMLELSSYEDIPHLLAPVVTDMKHAANALRWCVAEMERRYLLMSKLKVRNIAGFNERIREAEERGSTIMDPLFDPLTAVDGHAEPLKPLPYIVVIVDEFADMMMVVGKKVEELIARLAQKARASGIHLILATQRPSVDVITGLIKANIPTRIAFQVSTRIDSRTILDQGGAEQLLGHGDMLYMPPGTSLPQRVHGALVTDREVEDVANYLKLQGEPDYIADVLADTTSPSDAIPGLEPLAEREGESDPLYDEAVAIVAESRRASISYLQRRLKVGYNRAARMIEDMETAGVVSAVQSNGTREVLVPAPAKD